MTSADVVKADTEKEHQQQEQTFLVKSITLCSKGSTGLKMMMSKAG